jgi:hypothetical protein
MSNEIVTILLRASLARNDHEKKLEKLAFLCYVY